MLKGLSPYNDYQESGQDWLGRVPSHWELKPGHAAFAKRKVFNTGLIENTVLSLSYGKIIIKPVEKQHGLVPRSYETHQIVDEGNVIIRGTDLQNDKTSLRIGLANDRGIISGAYLCLEVKDKVIPEYGYEILNVFDLTKAIYRFGSGLRQNLDHGDIKRLPVFIPPPDEQVKIVKFLRHANRKIDQFIRAKQRLIGLLEEQEQNIIQAAVTRGLDQDTELKPSGIEWVGDIPAHWETPLNQRIFKENIRPHGDAPETQLSLSQRDGLIPTKHMKERSLQTSSFDNWKVVHPGDLVLNRFKAHLGVFFAATIRGIASFHYGVFEPQRPLNTKYFEYLCHTSPYKAIYGGRSNGMTVGLQNLSNQNFYSVRSLVPPLEEQNEIVDFVDRETASIRKTVLRIQREILLVREYRVRLTSDIVTGKLDVRAAAAGLPEIAESEIDPAELSFGDELLDDVDVEQLNE